MNDVNEYLEKFTLRGRKKEGSILTVDATERFLLVCI